MKTPLTVDAAEKLQLQLAKKVIKHDVLPHNSIKYVCGVDVSYVNEKAFACAAIVHRFTLDVIGSASHTATVEQAYLPGLFFLRESKPILEVLQKLEEDYDALMVDGHGVLHPRQCGLASTIGLEVKKPTIGVAKRLLCGNPSISDPNTVMLNGKVAGYVIRRTRKNLYVSIGHMISLKSAAKLAEELAKNGMPEPLRMAHLASRKLRKDYA